MVDTYTTDQAEARRKARLMAFGEEQRAAQLRAIFRDGETLRNNIHGPACECPGCWQELNR